MRALRGALCWLGVILTDLVGGGVPVTTSGVGLFAAVKPEDPPPAGACTIIVGCVQWNKDDRAQDERCIVTSMRLNERSKSAISDWIAQYHKSHKAGDGRRSADNSLYKSWVI